MPIVIESQDNKNAKALHSSKLNIPQDTASFEREVIDIRSYLSQSRSNMSPFARSSSYRSQYGRPNIEVSITTHFFYIIQVVNEYIALLLISPLNATASYR